MNSASAMIFQKNLDKGLSLTIKNVPQVSTLESSPCKEKFYESKSRKEQLLVF